MTGIRYNGYLGGKPRVKPPHEITPRDMAILALPVAALALATVLALSSAPEEHPATVVAESELVALPEGTTQLEVMSVVDPLQIAGWLSNNAANN